MSDPRIGDRLTITFRACDDREREVTVAGYVLTTDDVLALVEDAMRGVGYQVPTASLQIVRGKGER